MLARVTFDPMGETAPNEMKDMRQEKELGRRMKLTGELPNPHGYSEDCEGCRPA